MKLSQIFTVVALSLMLGACTVGRLGYIKPAANDNAMGGEPVAEHCFSAFPGSLNDASAAWEKKTSKKSWDNTSIALKQNFFDGCLQLRPLAGGN